jgi:hypothetical protein
MFDFFVSGLLLSVSEECLSDIALGIGCVDCAEDVMVFVRQRNKSGEATRKHSLSSEFASDHVAVKTHNSIGIEMFSIKRRPLPFFR